MADQFDITGAVDSYLKAGAPSPAREVRAAVTQAYGVNSDLEAGLLRLSRQTGIPVDSLRENRVQVERERQATSTDWDQFAKDFPGTTAFLARQQNANVAHDDTYSLTSFEGAMTALGSAAKYVVSAPGEKRGLIGDLAGVAKAGVFGASSGFAGLGRAVTEVAAPALDFLEPVTAIGGNPLRRLSEGFGMLSSAAKATSDAATPKADSAVGQGVVSGGVSLVQNLLTLPMALVPGGQAAALTGMVGMVGGGEYQKAREQGMGAAQALPYAASQAAIEYATEKLPLGKLLGDLASNATFRQMLVNQIKHEVPGEQIATALQDLNEWAVLPENKNKPFSEYLRERPNAALQTLIATAVGVGGNVTVMKALDQALTPTAVMEERARTAERQSTVLQQIDSLAQASKLRQRDPETFAQFVAHATENGPVKDVYLDAQTLMQSGKSAELARVSPAVAAQLQTAAATGGLIRIPVEEYASTIAGTELNQGLLDHLKTEPTGFSRAEAQQFLQSHQEELQRHVERAMTNEEDRTAAEESTAAVKASLKKQLDEVGRFTSDVHDKYATLAAAFYSTMAAKAGTTPEALFQQYPLTVREVAASAGKSLEQGGAKSVLDIKAIKKAHSDSNGQLVGTRASEAISQHAADALARGASVTLFVDGKPQKITSAAGGTLTDASGKDWGTVALLKNPTGRGGNRLEVQEKASPADTARGSYSPDTNTITLFKGADLSTFLHEAGHAFLEFQFDLSAKLLAKKNAGTTLTTGEQSILDDTGTLLSWFGVESQEEWFGLDFEEKRSHHEQFARGFESYLFEGKAPSIELQGVFQRFRAWLMSVYRNIANLNVELNDEVRGVLNRMLASDEEIKMAEMGRSMMPLFSSVEQSGMTPDEFAKYQELGARATQDAVDNLQARGLRDMQWLSNAKGRKVRELQKLSDHLRTEITFEVRREVQARPVYRAWQFITGKAGEKTPEQLAHAEALAAWKNDRAAAEEAATSKVKADLLAANPDVKGVQKGQLLSKNRRQMDILKQQIMLDWDRAHPEPKAPKAPVEGDTTGGFESGRLSEADLTELSLPAEVVKMLKARRMVAEGGLPISAVAEKFGFSSADAMVRELAAAAPAATEVESRVDRLMLERHGELATPEAINQAADEALHNEARTRMVSTEANALAEATGQRKVLLPAAKEFAAKLIAREKVRDLRPTKHTGAASRAARAAEKAMREGDLNTAAAEKRNQLIQGIAARAAYDAQAEVAATEAFFAKVVGGKDDTLAKTRDMDVVNAARAVLAQFGYGGKAKTAQEYLKTVQQNDPATYAVLIESVEAAQAISAPSIRELTVEQLRGLKDEVDALWHLSRRNRQMEIDGNLMDREEAASMLSDRLQELGVPDAAPGETSAITEAEQRAMNFASVKAAARRVESWVDRMDGDNKMGAFRRLVWTPVKEAADAYRTDKARFIGEFRKLFDQIAPSMKRAEISATEINYTFGKDTGGVAMNEILHALLHTGNESNKRKLLLGRGWATESTDGTLDTSRWDAFVARLVSEGTLTKEHFDFLQSVWDLLEQTKPLAQQAHRDAYGKYFAEIQGAEFVDPFGVTRRGGYVPATPDSRIVKDHELKKLIEEGKDGMAFAFPGTSKGFTKGRTEYNRPLMLDLRTLPQHIDAVLKFAHLEVPVRDVSRLLGTKDVNGALNRFDPAAVNVMLTPWLTRAARQQVTTPMVGVKWADKFLNTVRTRTSMATMLANVSNTAQQITGFLLAGVKVPMGQMLSATADFVANPKATAEQVAAMSPYMANRMSNEVEAMMGEIDAILLDPTLLERAQDWTKRHTFFMQSAVDNVMGPIIWKAAFNQALEEGYPTADSVRIADATIRQTQGSTLAEDVSLMETGPAYARLFTQFAGYFNMQANLLGTEFAKLVHSEMGLRRKAGRGLFLFLIGFYVPAMIAEAIAQAFRGGPGDEDKDGEYLDDWLKAVFLFGPIKNTTAFTPVVGQFINSAVARFNDNPTDDKVGMAPAIGAMEALVGVPHDLWKVANGEGNARKTVRDLATLISISLGLPASVAARPLGYLAGMADDKIDPTSDADLIRGLVTGAASPESKR